MSGDSLEEIQKFNNSSSKEETPALSQLIESIAKNGRTSHKWSDVKPFIRFKLEETINKAQFSGTNTKNQTFEQLKLRLLSQFDAFQEAPFTLQRLCEIILGLSAPYSNPHKTLYALEKSLTVTSTISLPNKQ
eukprot:c18957_g1_i3.p1 GENE.c18957_g1_i3~~c18957_g1_i3.p1  ORF type:complete len:133 (+),score=47.48 c18957_g1_i3:47-445(+)